MLAIVRIHTWWLLHKLMDIMTMHIVWHQLMLKLERQALDLYSVEWLMHMVTLMLLIQLPMVHTIFVCMLLMVNHNN